MMLAVSFPSSSRLLFYATAAALSLQFVPARGDGTPIPPQTVCELKHMSPCELDQVFAHGTATALPVGLGRGTILCRVEGKMPRMRTRMSGTVWKGKYFYPDGCFTNQWAGFRAIGSTAAIGPSWFDGKPCIILEYPAGTALFGNTRDELREIAPGLILGRFYERCPCQQLQGYFVLELECCNCK